MSFSFGAPQRVEGLVQGSPEWHAFRNEHCNASEAAAALNMGHFDPKTAVQLAQMRAGTRKKKVYFAATRHGHAHEEEVRQRLEAERGVIIVPSVWKREAMLENALIRIPMACSTDGIDEDGVVYEIKCPISPTSDALLAARAGIVPGYYFAQVQHQLLVTGMTRALFVVRDVELTDDSGRPRLHQILVDCDRPFQQGLLDAWLSLWPHLRDGTVPGPAGERRDCEWLLHAEEYRELKVQADALQKRMDEAKETLIRLAKDSGDRCVGGGVVLTRKSRAGTINYKAIPELQGVDLDFYRSKPTTYWSLDLEKPA